MGADTTVGLWILADEVVTKPFPKIRRHGYLMPKDAGPDGAQVLIFQEKHEEIDVPIPHPDMKRFGSGGTEKPQ